MKVVSKFKLIILCITCVFIGVIYYIGVQNTFQNNENVDKHSELLLSTGLGSTKDMRAAVEGLQKGQKNLEKNLRLLGAHISSNANIHHNSMQTDMYIETENSDSIPEETPFQKILRQREAEKEHYKRLEQFLQNRFVLQPEDEKWAKDTERTIEETASSLNSKNGYIVNVDCRTDICALDVEYADNGQQRNEFVKELLDTNSFQTQVFFTPPDEEPEDKTFYKIYLAKKGYKLNGTPKTVPDNERPFQSL